VGTEFVSAFGAFVMSVKRFLSFTSPFRSAVSPEEKTSKRQKLLEEEERVVTVEEETVLELEDSAVLCDAMPTGGEGGRGIGTDIATSAIHETVLTRVNEALLAFKPVDNPLLAQLVPALATAVAIAVGEVVKTVMKDLESQLFDRLPKTSNQHLLANITRLTYENDRLSQYTRRESVRIAGVKMEQGETAQGVEGKALKVFSDVGVKISPDDIAAVHRAGRPKNGTQPILVKFVSRKKRQEVMTMKKALKEKPECRGIFINDDLTPLRARLLGFVQRLDGVERAWTTDGRIFARRKLPVGMQSDELKRPVVIESPDDIFSRLKVVLESKDLISLGLGHLVPGAGDG